MRKISSTDFHTVGRKIYARRRQLGLSQQQAATALHCSLTHYSRIESGYRPSLEMIIDLCVFYDLSLDELLDLHPSKSPYLAELIALVSVRPPHEQQYLLNTVKRFLALMQSLQDHQDYRPYHGARQELYAALSDTGFGSAPSAMDEKAAEEPSGYGKEF